MDPIPAKKVRREASFTRFPTSPGEVHKRSQFPISNKAPLTALVHICNAMVFNLNFVLYSTYGLNNISQSVDLQEFIVHKYFVSERGHGTYLRIL